MQILPIHWPQSDFYWSFLQKLNNIVESGLPKTIDFAVNYFMIRYNPILLSEAINKNVYERKKNILQNQDFFHWWILRWAFGRRRSSICWDSHIADFVRTVLTSFNPLELVYYSTGSRQRRLVWRAAVVWWMGVWVDCGAREWMRS